MESTSRNDWDELLDATLVAADALLLVVARSVIAVEHEVTGPQLRVLVLIFRNGSTTPGAVANELNVHASNATRICRRLEARGYLERAQSASDRRSTIFGLTAAGQNLVSRVLLQRRLAVAAVVGRLDERGRASVRDGLATFARAAKNETSNLRSSAQPEIVRDFIELHPRQTAEKSSR